MSRAVRRKARALEVGAIVAGGDVYGCSIQTSAGNVRAIQGVELVEAEYWNRNKGLCCGAGGAQMFMEEQNEKRVNVKRTLQLLNTGADTIATACPFCMTMLTDGLKAEEKEEQIKQLDIAELLVQAIDLGEDVAEAAE